MPVLKKLRETTGESVQLFVREGDHLLFEAVDDLDRLEHALHFALVFASEKFF